MKLLEHHWSAEICEKSVNIGKFPLRRLLTTHFKLGNWEPCIRFYLYEISALKLLDSLFLSDQIIVTSFSKRIRSHFERTLRTTLLCVEWVKSDQVTMAGEFRGIWLEEVMVMRNTKRRPVTVGEMLVTEFLEPMNIEISERADAMGVHRNTLSRIAHDKGTLTAPMAIKFAAALGYTPEFWHEYSACG